MTMNNEMLMTHCCNCGHLVSKSASGTKSIMVCSKCGAEIEVTVCGKAVTVTLLRVKEARRNELNSPSIPQTLNPAMNRKERRD